MPTATEIIERFSHLQGARLNWDSHWREIAERVLPRHLDQFNSLGLSATKGEKNTEEMFDTSAAIALERFASTMESMLTPRTQKWHRLRSPIPEINRNMGNLRWFDELAEILFRFRYSPSANFASQQFENYISLGAFGTGVMFIDGNTPAGLRYKAVHISEVYFAENHQGLVDTVYRKFRMTARQARQRFGEERLGDKIRRALEDTKNSEQMFDFIHAVIPREDVDAARADFRGMRFASYYVALDDRVMVDEGGYATFPYALSRYVTAPDECYGRSPAMQVLPNIKVLNEQKKTMLKQGHRVVDPVLLSYDDGVVDSFSMRPGSINPGGVSAEGRELIKALPTGNLAAGQELMDMERAVINDAFLVSLFQILTESPRMTATEVLERTREKGALLAPTMGRQQSEALGPMIERELDILSRQGLLPEMPPEIAEAGGEFIVEYDSPLSRSMRAEEASGFMRTLEFALTYAQAAQDPSALDWLNFDTALPQIAEINAVPASWLRTIDEVGEIRQGRQVQQATQQLIEAGPSVAAVMKASAANG